MSGKLLTREGSLDSVVLLSRRQKLYAEASQWNLDDCELFLFDSPAEALARINMGQTTVFLFDTRDYPRYRHVIKKFLSLNQDADLVLIGDLVQQDLDLEIFEGAVSILSGGADGQEIAHSVQRALQLRIVRRNSGIIGRSRAVREMLAMVANSAPLDVNVLILGESGTGKEMVAQAIHRNSGRKDGPFVSINCGAMSAGVLESELFGHARGAFTGAVKDHAGVFRRADKGTLFLDEVAEMPLEMQTRFLRALETGEFTPVGGRSLQRSDIRLIAATHQDLAVAVARGQFRQDLYYRLRVVVIETPPLRERRDDILVLARVFLNHENKRHELHVRGMTRAAEQLLLAHDWPGNVRELRNAISSAVVIKQSGLIEVEDLPRDLRPEVGNPVAEGYLPVPLDYRPYQNLDPGMLAGSLLELRQELREIKEMLTRAGLGRVSSDAWHGSNRMAGSGHGPVVETFGDSDEFSPLGGEEGGDLQAAERTLIQQALRATGGNRRQAAERLGISERTLYRKLKHYGLT
ncbi:sigma-54-dependent Fis family transcriptional regulator [bacterium CG17_big_fil_post_rev_8_21_14_2_50_64_8]|nr:MAG: sigma-54-dependent Fis family transcriptional regulator [bacterium CG17_big_fil_post_rev_8_21_14_2_50_64_8]PJA75292.1 MAG: sigma-54-dependent Fis family transcriptional regulator [bacterium CG_4_9_14_3_um_filter_65_15]